MALVVIAKIGRKRQKQDGQKIYNIEAANIVILKQPTVEKVDNNFENHIYSIIATTQSQKKNLEAKKF